MQSPKCRHTYVLYRLGSTLIGRKCSILPLRLPPSSLYSLSGIIYPIVSCSGNQYTAVEQLPDFTIPRTRLYPRVGYSPGFSCGARDSQGFLPLIIGYDGFSFNMSFIEYIEYVEDVWQPIYGDIGLILLSCDSKRHKYNNTMSWAMNDLNHSICS